LRRRGRWSGRRVESAQNLARTEERLSAAKAAAVRAVEARHAELTAEARAVFALKREWLSRSALFHSLTASRLISLRAEAWLGSHAQVLRRGPALLAEMAGELEDAAANGAPSALAGEAYSALARAVSVRRRARCGV
jgi:hypothetical protein